MKKIIIEFDGDSVKTEAEGYEGTSCLGDTEKLIEHLKPKLQDRKLKPEYNRQKTGAKSLPKFG